MNPTTPVLLAVSLLLVFVASLARREPVRLPRRIAGPREEGAVRQVHRALVLQIGIGFAAAVMVFSAEELRATHILLFAGAVVLARVLGHWIGRVRPGIGRVLSPLLAPVDGAALLLDWLVSPLLPRRLPERERRGDQDRAYDQVLELTRSTVEQVMTPRSEVVWLREEAELAEIAETVRRRPHARYPVFHGDFERLIGMVDLVDLIEAAGEKKTAGALARPAIVVPETIGCDDLVDRMRRDRFDTAVVVDEFGGIAGLVTLEDLLEVIIGDLVGEHELMPVRGRRIGENAFIVDATLRIDEFEDLFGLSLPDGDYETVAGLFLSHVVRIPSPGEKIHLGNLHLEVLEADAHRIRKLKITFSPPPERASRDAGAAAGVETRGRR
ncbi:MAG: CBS domain-containing protein [Candidatus Eisenbacteria bacterium]|nr:CBS domain-containing protein [Candidatus Latescibacterota bacterium]MBD3301727.1 CBS domain-containing protein [Candidatus Eisenbacteria bacterium]